VYIYMKAQVFVYRLNKRMREREPLSWFIDSLDTRYAGQLVLQCLEADMMWHRVQQNGNGFSEQLHRCHNHNYGEEQRTKWIRILGTRLWVLKEFVH